MPLQYTVILLLGHYICAGKTTKDVRRQNLNSHYPVIPSILQGMVPNTQEESETCRQGSWMVGVCSVEGKNSSYILYFLSPRADRAGRGN